MEINGFTHETTTAIATAASNTRPTERAAVELDPSRADIRADMPSENRSENLGSLTDHELMLRVGAEDRRAWGVLVDRHQVQVVSLAYRFLGRWDLAEDAAQDAFIRVWRAAKKFRPEAKFTTWLYRLTANQCWDRRRQATREQHRLTLIPPPANPDNPANSLQQNERTKRIQRAVAALPDRQRLAVILHRYENMPHREIMDVTGWSQAAVESCLVRAYEVLRRSLSDIA